MVARSLGAGRRLVVASPAYLEHHGDPTTPDDLKAHQCISFGARGEGRSWTLQSGNRTLDVPVFSRLVVNDLEILKDAALAGVGVAMLPAYQCVGDLCAGRLRRVLPEWSSPETPAYAVYPSMRHLAPKVKAFLDLLQERVTALPWEIADKASQAKG